MATIEEIEKRRAERKAAAAEARAEQYAKDLEAIDALETESGEELQTLNAPRYVSGLPCVIGYKAPAPEYYKRFCHKVRKAGGNREATGAAQDELADSCWVYPADKEVRKAMMAAFPGTLISLAVEANKLVELKAEEEGKD